MSAIVLLGSLLPLHFVTYGWPKPWVLNCLSFLFAGLSFLAAPGLAVVTLVEVIKSRGKPVMFLTFVLSAVAMASWVAAIFL